MSAFLVPLRLPEHPENRPLAQLTGYAAAMAAVRIGSLSLEAAAVAMNTALDAHLLGHIYRVSAVSVLAEPVPSQVTVTATSTTATTATRTETETTTSSTTVTSRTTTTTSTTVSSTTTTAVFATSTSLTATDTSTSSTNQIVASIDGSLVLQMDAAYEQAFVVSAQAVVPEMVADLTQVPSSWVSATAALGNSIEVTFRITLPSDVAEVPTSLLPADSSSQSTADVLSSVAAAIAASYAALDLSSAQSTIQSSLSARLGAGAYAPTLEALNPMEVAQATVTVTSTTTTTTTVTGSTTTVTGTTSSTTSSTRTSTSTTRTSSTRTTSTFTTTNAVVMSLAGEVVLATSDNNEFVGDPAVQAAMPTIIADLVAIPPSFVAQTSLAIDGWENTVVVSYVITLPSNPANIPASLLPAGGVQGLAPREVQQEVAALITQRLTQMDLAAGAIQVQIALDAVILGNDYDVHVPTVARAPTLEQITVTATTTTTSTGTTSSTVSSTTGTTSTATSTSATSTTTTTNKVAGGLARASMF